jgi:hypothetical protein
MKFYLYDESEKLINYAEVIHDQLLEIGEQISGVLKSSQSTVEVIRILTTTSCEQHVIVK